MADCQGELNKVNNEEEEYSVDLACDAAGVPDRRFRAKDRGDVLNSVNEFLDRSQLTAQIKDKS